MKPNLKPGRDEFHLAPDQNAEMFRTRRNAFLPENGVRQFSPMIIIISLFAFFSCPVVQAGVQEAWIQKHTAWAGIGTNQAVAMALDSQGNIIVTGSSQSTNGDFDYVTLKYAPNGSNQWVQRYSSTNTSDDQVRALVLDKNDNVFVTGTSVTIKYNASGKLQWSAPFGGRALVADTNGNVYVTGYSDVDFSTVKLDQTGSNVWQRTFDAVGQPDISQQVTLDKEGNVYVAGVEKWFHSLQFGAYWWRYRMISYKADGAERFSTPFPSGALPEGIYGPDSVIRGIYSLNDCILFTGNLVGGVGAGTFGVGKVSLSGEFQGFLYLIPTDNEGMRASSLSSTAETYLTGGTLLDRFRHTTFRTYKVLTNGVVGASVGQTQPVWQADYIGLNTGYHRGNAIGLDAAGNVYVAGQSTGAGTVADGQDWVTIKYSPTGQEKWVKRYNGAARLNDVATCMAVTPAGEVYVAGWSQTSGNQVELVVIKYAQSASLTVETNRTVSLQFPGTPGVSNRVQATTNFLGWLDLGFSVADTNGLLHFQDTNAPAHPFRFYRTVTP